LGVPEGVPAAQEAPRTPAPPDSPAPPTRAPPRTPLPNPTPRAQMFGPDAPPLPWDAAGEYSRGTVELYYLANAGTPLTPTQLVDAMAGHWPEGLDRDTEGPTRYGPAAARWARVDEGASLREVLTAPGHIVAGAPLFFVVARGTEYRERFLAER
jgi:hypothetical protein